MPTTDNTPEITPPPLAELPPSSEIWELGGYDIAELLDAPAGAFSVSSIATVVDRGSGAALGFDLLQPPEPWEAIADLALQTCQEPHEGTPRLPAALVVARPELVPLLTERFQGTAVRIRLEHELPFARGLAIECLTEIASLGGPTGDYAEAGVPPTVTRELFDAAASFYKARPWQIFAGSALLELQLPGRDEPLYAVLMGASSPARGLALFADAEALLDMGGAEEAGPTVSLTFLRRAEAPEQLVAEARQHGWKLASEKAFPVAVRTVPTEEPTGDAEVRFADRDTAELLVLATRALAAFCSRHRRQLRNGEAMEGAESVRTAGGESVVVSLRVTGPDELPEVAAEEPGGAAEVGGHLPEIEELRELAARVPGSRSILRRLQWSFFRREAPFYGEADEQRTEQALFRFMEWATFAAPSSADGRTLAQRGIELAPNLSSAARRRLRNIAAARYGAFQIEQVERDVGLTLRDLSAGDSLEVRERLGSRQFDPGDLLLGAVFPDGAGRFVLSGVTLRLRDPGIEALAKAPKLGDAGPDFALAIEEQFFGATTHWIQEIDTPHELRKAYESFLAAMGGRSSRLPSLGMLQKQVRQADSPVEVLESLRDFEWWSAEEAKLFAGFLQRLWNMTPRPEPGEHSPEPVHRGARLHRGGGNRKRGKGKKRR